MRRRYVLAWREFERFEGRTVLLGLSERLDRPEEVIRRAAELADVAHMAEFRITAASGEERYVDLASILLWNHATSRLPAARWTSWRHELRTTCRREVFRSALRRAVDDAVFGEVIGADAGSQLVGLCDRLLAGAITAKSSDRCR